MDLKKLNGMYKLMESSLNDEDKPCVGIFWYSPAREECFGVVKAKDGDSNYKYDICLSLIIDTNPVDGCFTITKKTNIT